MRLWPVAGTLLITVIYHQQAPAHTIISWYQVMHLWQIQPVACYSYIRHCYTLSNRSHTCFPFLMICWWLWISPVPVHVRAGPGIDSRWCHWIFQWHISLRPHHVPGVDSAPSENEYQEHFRGVKAAGAWGWRPHHLHVSNVMKIWEPKPSGILWATAGLLRDCFTFLPVHVSLPFK